MSEQAASQIREAPSTLGATGSEFDVPTSLPGGWISFTAGAVCVGTIWLIVLPLIGDVPAVADHIALQKQGNIDPSAMFYTDLAIAPVVAARAERIHAENAECFWGWPASSPSLPTE